MEDTHSIEEQQIIADILNGNKQLYSVIVNRYKHRIFCFIQGMGIPREDAEDLVQETFIRAYRKLASHRLDSSFSAWLYKIAVNQAIDANRRQKNWLPQEYIAQKEVLNTPENVMLRSEMISEVHALLQVLKDEERLVILLRYTNELSYEEIANITGLSSHQVRNRLHRAKKRMKKALTEEVRDYELLEASSNGR